MARQRRSGSSLLMIFIVLIASFGAAFMIDRVLEKQRAEQAEAY